MLSNVMLTTEAEWRAAAADIGALIPDGATKHGWSVRNLRQEWTQEYIAFAVTCYGPQYVTVDRKLIIGLPAVLALAVHNGEHGTIEAPSLEELHRLIKEWLAAVWPHG